MAWLVRGRGANAANSAAGPGWSSNAIPTCRIRRSAITTGPSPTQSRADATTANSRAEAWQSFQLKLAAQGTETARHVAALTSLACGSTVMISIKANPVFRQYRRWRIQTLAGTRKGYTAAEMSQALETNIHMIQIAEMGGRPTLQAALHEREDTEYRATRPRRLYSDGTSKAGEWALRSGCGARRWSP